MRTVLAALAILISPLSLCAQQPEWQRVYTFDESAIDLDAASVNLIFPHRARVQFRWSLDKPAPSKYRTRLEVFEFDCLDERYRPYQVTLLDATGKVLSSEVYDPPGAWERVAHEKMIGKMYHSACRLIRQRTKATQPAHADELAAEKVESFAVMFLERLEEKRDFGPVVKEFFVPNYLDGHRRAGRRTCSAN